MISIKKWTLIKICIMYLVVFAMVGILGYFLYSAAFNALYESTLETSQTRLNDGLNSFTGQMTKMLISSDTCKETSAYAHFKYIQGDGDVRDSIYMLQMSSALNRMLLLQEPYVKEIYALFRNNNIFISSQTSSLSYRTAYGATLYDLDEVLDAESWRDMHFAYTAPLSLTPVMRLHSTYSTETLDYIVCVVKTNKVSYQKSDVIAFMIDVEKLIETFGDQDILAQSRVRLYNAADDVLYESGASIDSGLTITTEDSAYGIRAELIVPNAYFDLKLSELTRLIRLYLRIGIVGVFLLLALIAIRQYLPISSLLSISAQYASAGSLSNSYDFIGNAIQSIINSKNEADRRLAVENSASNNALIYNALKYGLYTRRDQQRLLSLIGEISEGYIVLLMRADDADAYDASEAENMMRERYQGRLVSAHENPGEMIFIIAAETEDVALALSQVTLELYAAFSARDLCVRIGLSERMWGIDKLHSAYQQARYAELAAEDEPIHPVLRYGADVEAKEEDALSPSALMKLNEILLTGSERGVCEFFDALKAVAGQPYYSGGRFMPLFYALGMTIQSAANTLGCEIGAFPEYLADEESRAALDKLQALALQVCQAVKTRRQSGNEAMKQSVIRYIDEHLSDPALCAEMVADALGLSRGAIYRILPEATGYTLAEYAEVSRMARVEQLLIKTDKSVDEIAALTGFGAVNTLYRVFKKRHGVPPGEWRKERKKLEID